MNHPPHLVSTWGSAFIPFCAYKTDLNVSKSNLSLPGLTFPLCSSFLPTILEGQLCYKLALKEPSGVGKRNTLLLLVDNNNERSFPTSSNNVDFNPVSSKTLLDFDEEDKHKVHISFLEPFEGFGEGLFIMTDVKKMTSKKDFLKLPLKDRNCKVESYEDCKTRKLLEECKCVPWDVPGFEVKTFEKKNYRICHRIYQNVTCKAGTALPTNHVLHLNARKAVMGSMLTLFYGTRL